MDNVLRCKTELQGAHFVTLCEFNGKLFKRTLKNKTPKDAMNEIVQYLVNQGCDIYNVNYPEINYG